MRSRSTRSNTRRRCGAARPAFSLAELLVVCGIIALLIALLLPPLQLARRQALQTTCAANEQSIGKALLHARTETGYYPYWDDGGAPIRYTWIDVLTQRRYLSGAAPTGAAPDPNPVGSGRPPAISAGGAKLAYCPADAAPDLWNEIRHPQLTYPLDRTHNGIDYSYGIGVPLSAGGWAWQQRLVTDGKPRRFRDADAGTSGRLLAADAYTSAIYNLEGHVIVTKQWSNPTQWGNRIAWGRHGAVDSPSANLLMQDGHVQTLEYDVRSATPVNTARTFVWYQGEPRSVGPDDSREGQFYPSVTPPTIMSVPPLEKFPHEMLPAWYTANRGWTLITHK